MHIHYTFGNNIYSLMYSLFGRRISFPYIFAVIHKNFTLEAMFFFFHIYDHLDIPCLKEYCQE